MNENASKIRFEALEVRDLPTVSRIHAVAFPKGIWTKLGNQVIEKFYLWHLTGPHEAFELTGAFIDGECVGFILTGIFNGSTTGFIRQNRKLLLKKILFRPWLATDEVFRQKIGSGLRLFKKSFRKTPARKDVVQDNRSYGFLSMGVLLDYQNRGVGTGLMKEAERLAVLKGYKRAHFTVNPANAKAIHIYERLGWRKILENETWKGLMRKELNDIPPEG